MKDLLILGAGESQFSPLPVTTETWGQNNIYQCHAVKYTRYFEIHPFTSLDGIWHRRGEDTFRGLSIQDYILALDALDCPIYAQPSAPFKNKRPPPSLTFRPFFDTTISYMLALAIKESFNSIYLSGIDMCSSDEYLQQRASVSYFCGLAEGLGIAIILPPGCKLLASEKLYPETTPRSLWKQRVLLLEQHIQKEQTKHNDLLQQYIGARNLLETVKDFYTTLSKEYS